MLLVVDCHGGLGISGTASGSLKMLILAKATAGLAEQAFADHDHEREQ